MPLKCPSIDVHLATFKKFQQAFSDETVLGKVMSEHPENFDEVKHLFKGIWTLEDIDNPESNLHEVIKKAIENPHGYVLKPQKEGGGHNFYDDEVKVKLETENKETLKQYLIMERIRTPDVWAHMLRGGVLRSCETT